MIIFGLFLTAIILWWIGKGFEKHSKREPTWNPDFCVLPGIDERSFVYEYDLPTQERRDAQFWAMVDFVNEQAVLKQRSIA